MDTDTPHNAAGTIKRAGVVQWASLLPHGKASAWTLVIKLRTSQRYIKEPFDDRRDGHIGWWKTGLNS